jgi:MATE family multidrug resistance protein
LSLLLEELRQLGRLSLPMVTGQLGVMMMGAVDTVMVGRVGVEAIAAASIANAWLFALLLFGQGLVQGIDPLITQAHGAGRGDEAARAVQGGALLSLLASIPLAGLALLTGPMLGWLGQPAELIGPAHEYVRVQIVSIPCFLLFITVRQYLQGREIVRPAMWVVLIANVFNAAVNYVLIFGHLGFPALGLYGAGIATALTRLFMLTLLVAWVIRFGLHRGAWVRLGNARAQLRSLRRVFSIGLPVALQISLETWAFSAGTLIAGGLGAVALASHTIVLNMAALSFMMPLGVSQGAVTRVGNLIGAGRRQAAQRAAWVAFGLGAGLMSLSACTFVALRHQLPRIYTSEADVIALCASILPIAAAFQIFDGLQVVGCGVLRGMGQTRPAAGFNFVAYWVIGLPLGAWLSLRQGYGLAGLWWALCLGLAIVAGCVLLWVGRRGPAHAPPSLAFVEPVGESPGP